MTRTVRLWPLLIFAGVVFLCMLSFYRTSPAAPPRVVEPFANPVAQRNEMVEQLKEINRQLREQNALLRSGRLTVVVRQDQKP